MGKKTVRKEYELVSGRYYRNIGGELIPLKPGDRFRPSGAEVKKLGSQIKLVETAETVETPVVTRPSPVKQAAKAKKAAAKAEKEATAPDAPAEAEVETEADAGATTEAAAASAAPATDTKEPLKAVEELGGGWYLLSDGRKVHGKSALDKALEEANG